MKPIQSLQPDRVFYNGNLITMADCGGTAVAVLNGSICAVGSDREIMDLAGPDTERTDLTGKTMLPGFYDTHGHFPSAGLVAVSSENCNSPPMGPVKKIDDIVQLLAERAKGIPEDQWVLGRGYDDTLLEEKRHPTRADLDRASQTHPICIVHTSGHFASANTRALERVGVHSDTPNPTGGVIRKDLITGEPDGVLEETAMRPVRNLIPPLDEAQWFEGLKIAVDEYVHEGVTSIVIAGCNSRDIARLQTAIDSGKLPLRMVCMTGKSKPGQQSILETSGLKTGFGTDRLRLGAVKMFQDGSIQGYTGYLSKPYHEPFMGDTQYRGYPMRSREALVEMVDEAHRAGKQIAIHGNGDAAIDDILSAYEQAQKKTPRTDTRHRIEHCQTVREDQLDKMQTLGVTPSFFVQHTYYWGDRHEAIFLGPERAHRISPLKSASDRGIRFTIHNDSPVTPTKSLFSVWSAVNRLSRSGQCMGEAQRIGLKLAFRAITIDAAWQNFEEDVKGSIEVGKLADFVVLESDPFAGDILAVKDIDVMETIVGGKTVYRKA